MMNIKQLLLGLFLVLFCVATYAQTADPALFSFLRWRNIGPFRGGRTVGSSGDLQHPNIFYMGVNNGGVWKTTDFGRTWNPIFDEAPTGSIGDVAVAPSNPNTIYVASGEGLQRPDLSVGDGMYLSTNAGKTWQHIGLAEGQQIGGIAIDPSNEHRVFAAVMGHPYGPNKERGVYRLEPSADGKPHWKQVLYIDENTGAAQVAIDHSNAKIIYADMFAGRLAPWENGMWAGPYSGLYKSVDGGDTWQPLRAGLPTAADGLDRIGFCIAPTNSNRMYAVVSANEGFGGLYRSDDAGLTWKMMSSDRRLWDRGTDFAEVKVDPKNEDIVYDANVVVWRSADGGKTWSGWKGAPGGDDYHRLWINPQNPDIILLSGDQGAGITVNGGATWSSWYNQPTAQLYHVSADNAFPYNVYSGQQESGSVGISSRGNDGGISFRDWHPVGAEEYGYVVADPLDANIVYGGKLSRYNKLTGQAQDISPAIAQPGKYRFIRTAPIVFSPVDNKTLYYAGNVLFKTRDGGNSWQVISPDLTRTTYDVAPCIGIYRSYSLNGMPPSGQTNSATQSVYATMPQRGVIYTIAPSPLDSNVIWAGTDDGLIQLTLDGGKTWKNVTPPGLTSWSKVSLMDASHTDKNTAYAAVNRIRLDDERPHIYVTHDGGTTWKEIIKGLPHDPINVVKEDPQCKGLLFAGSERAVYVSLNDGENWQSLRMNMPATSIRDLVIKDNDLVVATHGRSFWIMDDITSLRQLAKNKSRQKVRLYQPQTACRVRWNMNTDTPLPPDEPMGENPPDGAIIEYYLGESPKAAVTLDILNAATGEVVRHYSSADTPITIPELNIPLYWVRPQQLLPATKGAHRFLWDMHYQPLDVPPAYPMSAVYKNTAPECTGPWVLPGKYTARLTVDGKTDEQTFTVVMDPRVKTSLNDLEVQFELSKQCYQSRRILLAQVKAAKALKASLEKIALQEAHRNNQVGSQLANINALLNPQSVQGEMTIGAINARLEAAFNHLQSSDWPPTQLNFDEVKAASANYQQLIKSDKWKIVDEAIKRYGGEE